MEIVTKSETGVYCFKEPYDDVDIDGNSVILLRTMGSYTQNDLKLIKSRIKLIEDFENNNIK
jgi:hypothetical protein